jgi:hypothetical protein
MMSKKTAIIMILVVFLGALGALIWFYFTNNSVTPTQIIETPSSDVYDPFGTKAADNIIASSTNQAGVSDQGNFITANKLRQISVDPVSGFSLIQTKEGKTAVHYILRENGNIYETYTDSLEAKRLSITTVPKVYESLWLPDGNRLIIRYLKDKTINVETFSVKINPATTTLNEFEGGIDGNHLAENIGALAINPIGDKLFYLTSNLAGSSGFISKIDGLNKKLVFESPLIEWNVSWPKEEIITMTTRPASTIPGYMYFLNSKTGSFSKVLGGIRGLTTKTNSSTSEVLYSDSSRNTSRLYLFKTKNNESKLLPWNTFPEKCLWSNTDSKIIYCAVPKTLETGNYPDVWYQGLVSFTDDIWRINTDTGASTLVFDIQKEADKNIDITDFQIDKNDNYLFFTNKTDLTLWSLNLK